MNSPSASQYFRPARRLSEFWFLRIWELREPASKPLSVDRDDLDDVMKRLGVTARFQLHESGPVLEARLAEYEDFHPDQLFQKLELFESLRSRRKRIADSSTFKSEIAAIREQENPSHSPDASEEASADDGGNLLDQAIDLAQARQAPLEEQVVSGNLELGRLCQTTGCALPCGKSGPEAGGDVIEC